MLKMKIIILLLALSLVHCAIPTNEEKGETDLFISLSASQVNVLDFPLFIESMELINTEGEKFYITHALTINLANVGDNNLLIARHKKIQPGTYTRLKINLKFNNYSDVVFYGTSGELFTEKLMSSTGFLLGKDKNSLVIDVPVASNNGQLVVKDGVSSHLNLQFNLQNMLNIREGKKGVVIELRPIVAVNESQINNHLEMRGVINGFSKGILDVSSPFVSGSIAIGTEGLKNVRLDNKKITKVSNDKLLDQQAVASIFVDDKGTINLTSLDLFSEEKHIFKGVITEINKESIKLLGNNLASSNYFNQRNVNLTLGADRLPYPLDKLKVKMPLTIDLSDFRFKKDSGLKGPLLFGPDNYALDKEASPETKVEVVQNENDELFFYYSEKKHKEIENDDGKLPDNSGLKLVYTADMSLNGAYTDDDSAMPLDISSMKGDLEDGLYRADGFLRYLSKEGIFYFSPQNIIKVGVTKGEFYNVDITQGLVSGVFDFDRDEDVGDKIVDFFSNTFDSEIVSSIKAALEEGYDEIRIGKSGTKVSFIGTELPLFSSRTEKYELLCESLTFDYSDNVVEGVPKMIVQYVSGDAENKEITYIYQLTDLSDWFNSQEARIYVDVIDITGELTSKKDEKSCAFKTEFVYLVLLDNEAVRNGLKDALEEIEANNVVSRGVFNNTLIGIGAVVAVAALAGVVGILLNKLRKKKQQQKLAALADGEDGGDPADGQKKLGVSLDPEEIADNSTEKNKQVLGDNPELKESDDATKKVATSDVDLGEQPKVKPVNSTDLSLDLNKVNTNVKTGIDTNKLPNTSGGGVDLNKIPTGGGKPAIKPKPRR